jgi:hypothetical protein
MDDILSPEATPSSTNRADLAAFAARYPSIPKAEIAAVLMEARRAVDLFGLTREEELEMAGRIATALLRQRAGEDISVVRLDPEKHDRRRNTLRVDD